MFTCGFAIILVTYIRHWRIVGAGEAHFFVIHLLVDLEEVENQEGKGKYGKDILSDFQNFMKGLDNWCAEKINGRIINLAEFSKLAISTISKHYEDFQNKLTSLFNLDFLNQLKDYDSIKNLSNALRSIEAVFKSIEEDSKIQLIVDRETFLKKINNNLGKTGIASIITSIIGPLASFLGLS